MRQDGLSQGQISKTSLGTELATFRLLAQFLNELRYGEPQFNNMIIIHLRTKFHTPSRSLSLVISSKPKVNKTDNVRIT